MEYNVDQFGSTTITIRSFKIHNIQSWQEKSGKEFFSSDTIGFAEENVEDSKEVDQEINTMIKITYHKLYEFAKLFEYNNLSMKILEQSLSPTYNRE